MLPERKRFYGMTEHKDSEKKENYRAEAFDIMQNYYRTVHQPLIRCMIRFCGHADVEILRRAVSLSVSAVPQAACGLNPKTMCWEKSGYPEKMFCVIPETEKDTPEKLLLSTINFERGPQLKLILVRGKEADTLCVVVSHLIMDGGGFKEYLYLLANLYSRCAEDSAFCEKPVPGDRTVGQLLNGYSFAEKFAILMAEPAPIRQGAALYPPLQGEKGRPFFVRRVLREDVLSSVKSYGKSCGASVNDMLLTAYARALRDWTGQTHVEFPCPVDMRKYLKNRKSCGLCNMTSNYRCATEIAKGEPFETTLRKISAQMTAQKKSTACLKGPVMLNLLFHALPRPALCGLFPKIFSIPVVSYTNIGILDESRLVFQGTKIQDAFLVTAVKHAPYFQLSATTWRGECTITSAYCGTPEDKKRIGGFMAALERELAVAVG